MGNNEKTYVDEIASENSKFCIIALTGKVRAGTSDVCKLLMDPNFPDSATQSADTSEDDMSDVREQKLVYRYLHHNWRPFVHLSITDIIVSFILDSGMEKLKNEEIKIENEEQKRMDTVISEAISDINIDEISRQAIVVSNILQHVRNWSGVIEGVEDEWIQRKSEEIYKDVLPKMESVLKIWNETKKRLYQKETKIDDFIFCFGFLPVLRKRIRKCLGKNNYTIAFQKYGNNIRAYGCAIVDSKDNIEVNNIFAIPERTNKFIKMLRFYNNFAKQDDQQKLKKNPVFVVINNFKNIFEAYYFKRRYSAFYLLAVSCDEAKRISRFEDLNKFRVAELRENLSTGKRVYMKVKDEIPEGEKITEEICSKLGINKAEFEFLKEIYSNVTLIRTAYENNTAIFILQDVVTCVENSDIFVTRDYGEPDYTCDYPLIRQLARIVTLILHPGLLIPTKIERCMQIAMAAKLNSGCLSRQVGAVVTDSQFNILSLGWNDAPCGEESCIRRNFYDLLRKHDKAAYSWYELYNDEFREYLEVVKDVLNERKTELQGLPLAFCFKDIYQNIIKQKDQIHTRALHGEERALVSCNKELAKGGFLFTTSSPCELCAKKAKDASISRIYYIEQYPGISRPHIIQYGDKRNWATYELFVGVVGAAYVKLYTPVIPYKDELAILDFSPRDIYRKIMKGRISENKGNEDIEEEKREHKDTENEQFRQEQQIQQES